MGTGHKTRAIFDRYHIVNEQELHVAGDQLARYLAQQAPARAPRQGARGAADAPGRSGTSLRLVQPAPGAGIGPRAGARPR